MSFVDIAIEKVLEQMKNEGKSISFSYKEFPMGTYNSIKSNYEYEQKTTDNLDDYINGKTVPEIIQNLKQYYNEKKLNQKKDEKKGNKKDAAFYYLLEKIEAAGIKVVLDKEEFNRVLESKVPVQKMVAEPSPQYNNDLFDKEIEQLDKALQDYLSTPEKKLCDFILERVNKLYDKASDMYNSVSMDRKEYHKIITNKIKNPEFETCVQFAFGLKLDIDETTELFRLAGRAFSDSMYHRIVKYYIENNKHDIYLLNECLIKVGIKPIGCC